MDPEKNISTPAAAAAPVDIKTSAIRAWHDARTEAEKAEAVKKFPLLRQLYAQAANLKKD